MITPRQQLESWAGLLGGAVSWYGAHEASFYLVRQNCAGKPWIVPLIHLAALAITVSAGTLSFKQSRRARPLADSPAFEALIGTGAALVFVVVILFQGVAGLIYTGCER
jgi:hypothetical protein